MRGRRAKPQKLAWGAGFLEGACAIKTRPIELAAAETASGGAYMRAAALPRDVLARGGDRRRIEMIRTTLLATAFAFGAGLMAAGAAPAQSQAVDAAAQAPIAQPWDQSALPAGTLPPAPGTLTIKHWDPDQRFAPDPSQPTYSVAPPPDGPSGIYLPAVVLGYAKSAAGCVVLGCEDGAQVNGAPATPAVPAPPEPTSGSPSDQH